MPPARDVAKPDRYSERVPIAARRQMTNNAAISKHRLVVKEKPFGVGELELQKAASEARVRFAQYGLAPNEVAEPAALFLDFHGKA